MTRLSHAAMGTTVTIETVAGAAALAARAMRSFLAVERCCSRFDSTSELQQLCARPRTPRAVSPILFECVAFALAVAAETDGVFDPTVGRLLARAGFDRHYRTGARAATCGADELPVTWRDVHCDRTTHTITLQRPLQLDLGAVAKGLAIDLARRVLEPLGDFMIEAGGDVYVSGRNPSGGTWRTGIRHPWHPDAMADVIQGSGVAICTSGNYERPGHLRAATTGSPVEGLASVTVVAESAMVADALGTAAFLLGPVEGPAFLRRQGVRGLFIRHARHRAMTAHGATPGTVEPAHPA